MAAKSGKGAKKGRTGKKAKAARKAKEPAGKRDKKAKKRTNSDAVPEPDVRNGEIIDMEEAIRLLKTTRPTFYRWLRAGKVKGMKVGRQWRFYRDDIKRFLKGEAPRIDLPADIGPLVKMLEKKAREFGWRGGPENGRKGVKLAVDMILFLGMSMGASDIHLTSHIETESGRNVSILRCRVDGVLQQVAQIDIRLLPAIVERLKYMAACDIHEKAKPQDGRILVNFSEHGAGESQKRVDLRVNFLPAALGEAVTVKILDASTVALNLDTIEYSKDDMKRLRRALDLPWGVILVTGPTGSGKTTVLYSCLNRLARPGIEIMTVEDPVEYSLPWATQVPIRPSAGVTFTTAIRACLRSDPDVMMVGEIRNLEALSIVMQVALVGHLVLSTLHTTEAASALKRMVDIGADPFVIADATKLVLAQRLIRKLCPHCSVEAEPEPHYLERAAELAREGGLGWQSLRPRFRKRVGCKKCNRTGYRGRTVIAETLEVTPKIGRCLKNDPSVEELRAVAVRQGMTTMAADGIRRAANGETTLEEIMRVVG